MASYRSDTSILMSLSQLSQEYLEDGLRNSSDEFDTAVSADRISIFHNLFFEGFYEAPQEDGLTHNESTSPSSFVHNASRATTGCQGSGGQDEAGLVEGVVKITEGHNTGDDPIALKEGATPCKRRVGVPKSPTETEVTSLWASIHVINHCIQR